MYPAMTLRYLYTIRCPPSASNGRDRTKCLRTRAWACFWRRSAPARASAAPATAQMHPSSQKPCCKCVLIALFVLFLERLSVAEHAHILQAQTEPPTMLFSAHSWERHSRDKIFPSIKRAPHVLARICANQLVTARNSPKVVGHNMQLPSPRDRTQ